MKCGILFILSFIFVVHQNDALVDQIRFVNGQQFKNTHELNISDLVNHSLYKQKYGQLTVQMDFPMHNNRYFKIYQWDNILRVGSDIAVPFLLAFGKLIERLSVSFIFIPEHELTLFGKLVSDHCSETLIELKCQFKEYDAFEDVKVPFKKVESVGIEGAKNWSEKSLKFPDLFL